MLERVSAALFRAPAGADIQIVAEAQNNNGVNAATFEYAGQPVAAESILNLPGCSFTVADATEDFEAGVVFDPAAPPTARYDLFEIENGVKRPLQKFVRNSDSLPVLAFTLEATFLEMELEPAGLQEVAGRRATKRARRKPQARKAARKAAARPTRARKSARKTSARKTTGRRSTRKRSTSRKRK